MKGRALTSGCNRNDEKGKEGQVPFSSIVYTYMTNGQLRLEEKGNPIFVVRDRRAKMTWARVVPCEKEHACFKGTGELLEHTVI